MEQKALPMIAIIITKTIRDESFSIAYDMNLDQKE